MMSSLSIVTPERRIELNRFDVDAWNLLLRESQTKPIDSVRSVYENLVGQFPNSGRYWKAFIDHELRGKNYDNVEKLFARCLVHVLNIDLWKCYVHYVRETKGHLSSFREKMAQAYEFALDKVGLDMNSYSIYADYISFLKSAPTVGQYAENQRVTAVRKIYQRGIVTPMLNIEQLWSEYCTYEKGVNANLAEKLLSERSKDYQVARRTSKALEQVTRGLNRQAVSVPPRGTAAEMKQLEMWRKYILWEKSNPLGTEEYSHYARRVIYAYEQALLCLGYHPDIWYEAAIFQQQAASILADKGDIKFSTVLYADITQHFERAIGGLLKDSQLMFFAYADFEEEQMRFDHVKKIYDRLLQIESVDPTLTYIQLMKFVRRTEGIQGARIIFKKARQDPRCKFHVFVASALMEYYCSKDTDVATRVFEMGMKKYGNEPYYALAFVDFLSHLNEDNNTRVAFERILTSEIMPKPKTSEIWDKYLEFETNVGDLPSILKVDRRRREAFGEYSEMQTVLLIDRYKFLDLLPCTSDQLKLMGYSKIGRHSGSIGARSCNSNSNPNQSTGSNITHTGAVSVHGPSVVMGGGVSVEISGYPRPDTDQMIPFKPKSNSATSYHPVSGGVFPPPSAVAVLMQMLPPPSSFSGPFVSIELLMDSLMKINLGANQAADINVKVENGVMFGAHQYGDVKKEFYQLLATTTDPYVILSSSEYQQQGLLNTRKRQVGGGDSDSDDDTQISRATGACRDIYKKRMNLKAQE